MRIWSTKVGKAGGGGGYEGTRGTPTIDGDLVYAIGQFGDPRMRDPQSVRDDVLDGLIAVEEARRDYGVVIDARGEIDLAETARVRSL